MRYSDDVKNLTRQLVQSGVGLRETGRRLRVPYDRVRIWCNATAASAEKTKVTKYQNLNPDKRRAYDNHYHATHNGWANMALCSAARRAKQKNLPFSITMRDVVAVIPIDGKCPVFGFPMKFAGGPVARHSASLDRIIPSEGYVASNIAVISCKANAIKQDATAQELQRVADWLVCQQAELLAKYPNPVSPFLADGPPDEYKETQNAGPVSIY